MAIETVIRKLRLHERDDRRREYWLTLPVQERLAHAQELRSQCYGRPDRDAPDFLGFINCCIANDLRFLIVGGWAMAAHDHARATADIYVWMRLVPFIGRDDFLADKRAAVRFQDLAGVDRPAGP